ncbi:MAG: oligosaccharide flippase family protein [Anaerocolumna sp.]
MTRNKSNLIKGTAILTLAGILTRFIGFFYRIFLSNAMGPELLGIYQLIFPVYGICFTIFASGIQTAISTLVANEIGKKQYQNIIKILHIGILMSASLSLVLAYFTYQYSDLIATKFLGEALASSSIRILAISFPFCGITSCINGYYYGLKKAGIPATTQLLEQIVRVLVVYFVATFAGGGDVKVTCDLAVIGLVFGEIASQIYNIASMYITPTSRAMYKLSSNQDSSTSSKSLFKQLFKMTVPLTANRLFISILHSIEAILIPGMLKKSGLSSSDALSVYGILTGMSIPFIMFPSAITNSLSVLLLPTISEAKSSNNRELISKTTAVTIKYSLLIGILSAGIFITFGNELGSLVYHNELAGKFLTTIAWLCPFLYITTTLSSIINGLGLAHLTFASSVIGLTMRIIIILILVPMQGINGYLNSFLISQLIMTFFEGLIVASKTKLTFDAINMILKPIAIIAFTCFMAKKIYVYLPDDLHGIIIVLAAIVGISLISLILLCITKAVSLKDFK